MARRHLIFEQDSFGYFAHGLFHSTVRVDPVYNPEHPYEPQGWRVQWSWSKKTPVLRRGLQVAMDLARRKYWEEIRKWTDD